jgi:quercetin dioxygenase-like cupin family protein
VSDRRYPARVTPRKACTALLTTVLLAVAVAACAQPGQLGGPPAPAPAPAAAPPAPAPVAPAPPTGPVVIGSGVVGERLNVRTTGPVEYSVQTVVLGPGDDTGWQRLQGTELTIVKSGDVALQRSDACAPARVDAGSTVVVPEGRPHVLRNVGPGPAELVVTRFLQPGSAKQAGVPAAC